MIGKKSAPAPGVRPHLRKFSCLKLFFRFFLLPVLLLFSIHVSDAAAAENAADSRKVLKRRVVRVGYFPLEHFHEIDRAGRRSGCGYEYLQELRNCTNWIYAYSRAGLEWQDMFPLLRAGEIDMLPGVSKTPEREAEFAFSSRPMLKVPTLLTVKAGNLRYRPGDYRNWNGIRVGLLKNSAQSEKFFQFSKEKGFSFHPVWFDREPEQLAALQSGERIDAAVTGSLRDIGSSEWLCERFNVSERYIAVRKNDISLRNELERAMGVLESQQPDLQKRLLDVHAVRPQSGLLAFSVEENAFLETLQKSGRVFTCALNPDRRPFSWFADGEFHGILKDYADELSRRTGLKFRFLPFRTRAEYYKERFSPGVDLIFDFGRDLPQAERRNLHLSRVYFSAQVTMLRDKNAGAAVRTATVFESGDLALQVRKILPSDVTLRTAATLNELIEDVKSSASDVAYMYARSAEFAVAEDENATLVALDVPGMENSFVIAARDTLDSRLLPVLNGGLKSIDSSFANQVRRRYMPSFHDGVTLKQFVYRHPLLAVGGPAAVLLLLCALLAFSLSRRKKLYQLGVLFSELPLRCFVMDGKGRFLHYTLGQRSTLSAAPKLNGIDDIPDASLRDLMRKKLAVVLQSGQAVSLEFPFDGKYRSAVLSKLPESVFGGNTAIWISQDISALQASRDEARRQEEFFRLTLDSIGDGAITTDAKGDILRLNPVAERLIGMSCAKAVGKPHEKIFRIVSAIDGVPVPSPLRKALDSGDIVELGNHTDLLSFDGQRYHIADCAGPIRDRCGDIIGAILIFRDVTQDYIRREELRESVANWEAASDLALLHAYRVNLKTRQAFGDLARLQRYWPIVDGKVIPVEEWVVPDDAKKIRDLCESVKSGATKDFIVNYRAGSDVPPRHFRWFGRLDPNHPGIVSGLVQDITDIKAAESERNAARSLWEQAFHALPLLMFMKSAENDFRYLQCNDKFSALVGRTPEEVVGRTDAEIYCRQQDADAFRDWDRKIMEGGKPWEFCESATGADGRTYHFQTVKMPFRDACGRPILIGMSADITEVVEQRERLNQTTRMWQRIMDELPVLFFVKDVDNDCRYLMCNKANAEFLGRPASEVIGRTSSEIVSSSLALGGYLETERRIIEQNVIDRSRTNIPDSKGLYREMEKIELPVSDAEGKRLVVGIAFDITEREQSLRLAKISAKILSGIVFEQDFDRSLEIVGRAAIDILSCWRVVFARCGGDGKLHFLKECDSDHGHRFIDGPVAVHEALWNSYFERLAKNEIFCFDRMGEAPELRGFCEKYPEYKNISLAVVPGIFEEKLSGIMIVTFAMPRHFTDAERGVLRAIMDCVLIATDREKRAQTLLLSQKEQDRQRKDREAINECLKTFISSDYMNVPFERILEIIRIRLGASYCFVMQFDAEKGTETCLAEAADGAKAFAEKESIPFDSASPWYLGLKEKEAVLQRELAVPGTLSRLGVPRSGSSRVKKADAAWFAALNPSGELWGALKIVYDDHSDRRPNGEDESFVRSAARLVSLILMRSLSRDRLIRTSDELAEALKQAQSAEKAKSYFLSSMSHEIRTPLNAVIGFTELMKDSAMDHDARQECLENIYVSGNALLQLINDILDLSKLEADQMQIIPERVDFPKYCNEVCRPFSYSAGRKMLNLLVRVPDSMPQLMLDQLRIRQILFNLIGNAIKFTREGSVQVTAVFTPSSAFDGALLLQVSDTGIGISEADQKKLFEPFVQLSKMRGTNASNSGTGLGLVIVRKLIDKMGGTLTMESEEGKGTTFSILLPQVRIADDSESVEPSPAPGAPAPEQGREAPPHSEPPADGGGQKGIRALVVDDIPMNTKILVTMLKRIRVESVAVHSGFEALELLKNEPFDWVLTDLQMPEMSGIELARAIRSNPANDAVRLAVITADGDAVRMESELFEAVLTKPVRIKQLNECLFRSEKE